MKENVNEHTLIIRKESLMPKLPFKFQMLGGEYLKERLVKFAPDMPSNPSNTRMCVS